MSGKLPPNPFNADDLFKPPPKPARLPNPPNLAKPPDPVSREPLPKPPKGIKLPEEDGSPNPRSKVTIAVRVDLLDRVYAELAHGAGKGFWELQDVWDAIIESYFKGLPVKECPPGFRERFERYGKNK